MEKQSVEFAADGFSDHEICPQTKLSGKKKRARDANVRFANLAGGDLFIGSSVRRGARRSEDPDRYETQFRVPAE